MRWLAFAIVACGGQMTQAEFGPFKDRIDGENATTLDASLAAWHYAHVGLAGFDAEPADATSARDLPDPPGFVRDETLYVDPESHELGFGSTRCLVRNSCGPCSMPQSYKLFRSSTGDVAILRLQPLFDSRSIRFATCWYVEDCDKLPPEPKRPIYRLGVTDPQRVTVYELSYKYTLINRQCDDGDFGP